MDAQIPDAAKLKGSAELFVLSGSDVGRSYAIVHGSSLGRAPDRSVVLRDRSISRHHAHFEFADGKWSIVDDGSTNGFIVDGVRLPRAELSDLRDFVIGEVLVRLRTQGQGAPSATAPVAPPAATPIVRAPAPVSAQDEIVIEDELLLDSDPEATNPTVQRSPPRSSPVVATAAPRPGADPGLATRGRRVLQYHKQDARKGLMVTDIAQRPLWVRALVYTVVLAIAVALGWGAFRGVLSLREGSSGSTQP